VAAQPRPYHLRPVRHLNQRYAFLCSEPLDPRVGYGTASYTFGLMAALSARGRKIGLVEPSLGPTKTHLRRWWFNWHLPRHVNDLDVDCVVGVGLNGYRYARQPQRRPFALLVDRLSVQEANYSVGKRRRQDLGESRWQERAVRAADLVLVPSEALRSQVIARYELPSAGVHVLLPGIEVDDWPPQPPKNEGPPTVLTTGRLMYRKGLDLLIDAWPTVLQSVPRARLFIVGDGPQHSELLHQIRRLNVGDQIQFRAAVPQSQIKHYLAGCDLVCIPSRHEDFSMAALEAMASARAIVATQTEAMTECVGDTAHLVNVDNPHALTEALVDLLSSAGRRERLADAGVARAQTMKWQTPALRMGELLAEI
jgi:glycosyltransferase involved in cell wall biosynthesis